MIMFYSGIGKSDYFERHLIGRMKIDVMMTYFEFANQPASKKFRALALIRRKRRLRKLQLKSKKRKRSK